MTVVTEERVAQNTTGENDSRTWRLRLVKSALSGEPYEERLKPPGRISFAPEDRCTSGRLNFRRELTERVFTENPKTGNMDAPLNGRSNLYQIKMKKKVPAFLEVALKYALRKFGCKNLTLNELINMIARTYLPELQSYVQPFREAKERFVDMRINPRIDRRAHSQMRQLISRCDIEMNVSGDGSPAVSIPHVYLAPYTDEESEIQDKDIHAWVQSIRTDLGADDDNGAGLSNGHVVVLLACMAIRDQSDSAVRPDDRESAASIFETFLFRLEVLTDLANAIADRLEARA